MDVKSRHHLRSDAVAAIETALAANLGVDIDAETVENVELTDGEWNIVLVDGEPLVLYVETGNGREPFLTVRGANEFPPDDHVVTVDPGAIQFVSNGADVMRPGIVAADTSIDEGDLVVVTEETHRKALAVGQALVDGSEMLGTEGRVVESIHHVGDELYEFDI